MNGGGQMFNVPLEYYGAYGLGQGMLGAAQVGQNIIETRRARKKEDRLEQLQQLQAVAEIFGKGSPQYEALAREFTGDPTAEPFVPFSETQQRNVEAALERVRNGTATQDDITLVNSAMYGHALGLPGLRTGAEQQQTIGGQQVTRGAQEIRSGERQEQTEVQYDEALSARGQTRGGLMATLDIGKIEEQEIGIEGGRLQNRLRERQITTEGIQQQLMRAQIDRYRAEARAVVAEANNPFANKDAEFLAGLAKRMGDAGYQLPSVQYLAQGINGDLAEDQQEVFNGAYQRFVTEQRQLFEAEMNRAIAENPNSPQALASRNLKAYYDAEAAGRRLDVSDEQLEQWTAQAMGGEVAIEEGVFRDKYIFRWTPPTPGAVNNPDQPGGQQIDQTTVDRTLNSMLEQHGSPERVASILAGLNSNAPQMDEALRAQFRSKYPNIELTPSTVRAREGTSGREISFEVPPRPGIPEGMPLSDGERRRVQDSIAQRASLVTRANEDLARGRQPLPFVRNGIERIDNYLRTFQERHTENVQERRNLIDRLSRIEQALDDATGNNRQSLERQRRTIQRRLDALENR